jgi:putative transposase
MTDQIWILRPTPVSPRVGNPGIKVLPRRWVVERTFAWFTRWRRLVRDYEQRLDVSEAMIHVAMGSLLLRRISH